MEKISETLNSNSNNSNLNKNYSNNSNNNSYSLTPIEEDNLIFWADDLIDPKYRLWFIVQLRRVGKVTFTNNAKIAKGYQGSSRQRVFASLLKRA